MRKLRYVTAGWRDRVFEEAWARAAICCFGAGRG
jgi:hypothetical protein